MLWIAPISPNSLNLGVKSGKQVSQLWPHTVTEKHVVVTILEPTHQSQPSPTIHYTYNDILEGLGCCELPKPFNTHAIWVGNVSMGMGQAKFVPSQSWNIGCGDHFCAHIPISTMSNHSLYLWREIGRVEMLWNGWISLYRLYLGMKCRGHAPKFSSPVTQKPGCGDGCGGWIPVSTFSNHSLYL